MVDMQYVFRLFPGGRAVMCGGGKNYIWTDCFVYDRAAGAKNWMWTKLATMSIGRANYAPVQLTENDFWITGDKSENTPVIKLGHSFIRAYSYMAGKDRVRKELRCV